MIHWFVRRRCVAGQSLVEVVLLLALLAIVAVVALSVLGYTTSTAFEKVNGALGGTTAPTSTPSSSTPPLMTSTPAGSLPTPTTSTPSSSTPPLMTSTPVVSIPTAT